MSPEEGNEDDQRAGAHLLRRQAEEMGLFNLENRKLQGNIIAAFLYLNGAYKKAREGLIFRYVGLGQGVLALGVMALN